MTDLKTYYTELNKQALFKGFVMDALGISEKTFYRYVNGEVELKPHVLRIIEQQIQKVEIYDQG